ncbi:hypothetical protein G647_01684 [Cladophialophora carrionii CBS 160.54]|uniref:Xylanolytic transcriptional activator regulatory domain-containing protein n=1 Tax=Cladophialophora carrionii CBS 160.54 TaxID=1279043 RepID=V9DRE0_9EURO|nr:uncharacterized protein G647_01684 [Cladophialophora carrionii CBS 160.54]ETI29231.1 hypothetical protein G647_01684 [Cladophialophora carrionii CBS 160.54]
MDNVLQRSRPAGFSGSCNSDDTQSMGDCEPNAAQVSTPVPPTGGQIRDSVPTTGPLQEREINAVPMQTLMEVTTPQDTPASGGRIEVEAAAQGRDLISTSELSPSHASDLFILFRDRMNRYLWGGVAFPHDSLPPVRRSSRLLSTVVFTIASLHVPDKEAQFDMCYKEYVSLVAEAMIARHHNLDDIRALVLGAFWLPDLSWKLSGLAVRIATELNLHQAFHQPSSFEDETKFTNARLWYLLYVCDRHFSITHGRPPMLNGNSAIDKYDKFLASPLSTPGDKRLISQVDLFQTLDEAYHTFGADTTLPLEESNFQVLRQFTVKVEKWRLEWESRLVLDPLIDTYPSKGVALHYHLAKLQLNSLALRGMLLGASLSVDRMDAAHVAVASAMAALRLVLDEPCIRASIIGVPLFKHAMFTFSAVFLLKVSCQWNAALYIDQAQVLDLVQSVVDLTRSFSINRRHLVYHITKGLAEAVQRIRGKAIISRDADAHQQNHPQSHNATGLSASFIAAPLVATNGNGTSHPQQQQQQNPQRLPPSYSPVDPHLADLFDEFAVADGLNIAANNWLSYVSMDAYSCPSANPQDTAAPMAWDMESGGHNNAAGVDDAGASHQHFSWD